MSRVLIVFAHPSHNSYNSSILRKVIDGLEENRHEIQVNDLYAMRFDPVMTEEEVYSQYTPDIISQEQAKVLWADTLFFIFPIWWWGPPAILKGWLERVLCLDFAFRYDIRHVGFVGTLQDRKAVVISTGSSDPSHYSVNWQTASHKDYVRDILVTTGLTIIRQMDFYNIHQYRAQSELSEYLRDVYSFAKTVILDSESG